MDLAFSAPQSCEPEFPYYPARGIEEIRVLVVDHHDAIRRGMRSLLETRKNVHVVGDAANGRDALRLAEQEQPDIAILGLLLPELNGLDLTRALNRACPGINVMAYTACNRNDVVTEVLAAGARAYVLKEDSEAHLLDAVDALCVGRPYFSPAIADTLLDRLKDTDFEIPRDVLTSREREIVQLIAEGKLNKRIAFELGITIKTVETHRMSAMRKLKIRNTAELVRWAIRNHLVEA